MTLEATQPSERITTLLTRFGLSTAAREWVPASCKRSRTARFR